MDESRGADRISSLSDDLLLHFLLHLGHASNAARTSLLSRQWRGLYSLLPEVDVTLHDVLDLLETVLLRTVHSRVRLLDITVPGEQDYDGGIRFVNAAAVSSVLRAAERLSPSELCFTLPQNLIISPYIAVDLPCFNSAISIELYARRLPLTHSRGFPLLESLFLSSCHLHLATVIPRCPRLRVLTVSTDDDDITVHSSSLHELVLESKITSTGRINIDTPVLKQLTMSFLPTSQLNVSVLAPMVEKVSWCCSRTLGHWILSKASLQMRTMTEKPQGLAGGQEEMLPRVPICTKDTFSFQNAQLEITTEIGKHMSTHFSVWELHLKPAGHVSGCFVLHLLGMHPATRSLKIVMLISEERQACTINCPCDDEPIDWRTQDIFLLNLEKVEIEVFRGRKHEFDFLNLLFRCASSLTIVTVRLSKEVKPSDADWCRKLYDIFKAYPLVECIVDFIPGHD